MHLGIVQPFKNKKTMKLYAYLFLMLSFFFACSEEEINNNETNTDGKEFVFTASLNVNQGDDIETRADDYTLSTLYPKDELYLMVKGDNQYTATKLSLSDVGGSSKALVLVLNSLVEEGKNIISMEDEDGTTVKIDVSGGKEVEVYFSSIGETTVSLTTSDVKTPGGKNTYAPIGDELFRSDSYYFSIDDHRNILLRRPNGTEGTACCEEENLIMLNRCTSVLSAKLVITQRNYSDLGNSIIYTCTDEVFKEKMNTSSISDWSTQFFIANFPIQYNMIRGEGESFSARVGGVVDNGTRGNIVLTENAFTFEEGVTATDSRPDEDDSSHEINITYAGVGAYNYSTEVYPYVYWMSSDAMGSCPIHVCISNGSETKSFQFIYTGELGYGNHVRLNIVVFVEDLAEAFNTNSTNRMKSSNGEEYITIPYKIFVERTSLQQ